MARGWHHQNVTNLIGLPLSYLEDRQDQFEKQLGDESVPFIVGMKTIEIPDQGCCSNSHKSSLFSRSLLDWICSSLQGERTSNPREHLACPPNPTSSLMACCFSS